MLLNKLIIIISFFIYSISFANEKEKVLFEIAGMPVTTIDLNQRINYLRLFNSISDKDIENNVYYDDLISVMLFNQFSLKINMKADKNTVEDYYNMIINNFEKDNAIKFEKSIYSEKLSKNIIINNIIYDLQRQKILQILLNERNDNISNKSYQNNLLNTFDINFNYFIIQNKYKDKFIKINDIPTINNIDEIYKILNDNKIKFNFYNSNITDFSIMDEVIKNNILNGINEFFIYQNEYILLGIVNKIIKKNIDLEYSIFQIKYTSENDLSDMNIQCENINDIKNNNKFEINQYDNIGIEKLNTKIIEKLIKKNDIVLIENDNQKYLLLLCDIEYSNELAENLLYQENIKKIVNEIEKEFIQLKKNEYNFKLYSK